MATERKPRKRGIKPLTQNPVAQQMIIGALEAGYSLQKALEGTSYSRAAFRNACEVDERFADAVEDAKQGGTDTLEDEARRRAVMGTPEPVYYKGEQCGTVRKYSDSLLMFLLKARDRERFGDKVQMTDKDGGAFTEDPVERISKAKMRAVRARASQNKTPAATPAPSLEDALS